MKLSSENMASAVPLVASDDWRDAFETQCTEDLLKKAKRFAERRARRLRRAGGVADDYYVRELVQDVIGDTAAGVLRWDHHAERLEDHVMDAIASRVHHDVIHAKQFPRVAIDAADADASQAAMAAVDATLLAEREASAATVALVEAAYGELWELAVDDPDARSYLHALAKGATAKADVTLLTSMSDHRYDAARKRMDRFVARLSRDAQPSRRRRKKRA